jgi:D-3-phosphoglycerate dehydrogenase
MAVARNIGDAAQSIKAGKWERSRLVGVEAKGKTLAIVGLGKGKSHDKIPLGALLTLP